MIAWWMVAATAIAALLACAAIAVERVARLWRLPARQVWSAALAASVVLPLAIPLLPAVRPAPAPASATAQARRLAAVVIRAPGEARARLARADLDVPLAAAWLALSALAAGTVVRGAVSLARARRTWRARDVDGTPVLVAPDVGPAVVGLRAPAIVLPEWALALDAPLRALVVRHETEHVRGGDPRHLALGVLGVIAMPWNLALWWMLRRQRTALEIDCDARVLAAHRDVARYGLLLLAVAQRRTGSLGTLVGAPALSESTSELGRRITAMRTPPPHRRAVRTALSLTASALAVAGAVAACAASRDVVAPRDNGLRPGRAPAATQPTAANGPYFEFQVEQPVTPSPGNRGPLYPDSLRAARVEGTVLAQFVVDRDGTVMPGTFKVLRADHTLFVDAVRTALADMTFVPAKVGGQSVRQLVQQPFMFSLSK